MIITFPALRSLALAAAFGNGFCAMALFSRKKDSVPDQSALARIGARVRARLEADPHVHKVPVKDAEIFAFGRFLDLGECFRLTAMIDAVAQPSTLFDGENNDPDYRTSYSGHLYRDDPFITMIDRKIDDLLGMDPPCGETLQGQRYLPGQQYKQHCDFLYTNTSYWKSEKKRGGQRSWTAMCYLNDVEEGGATEFPRLGVTVTPEAGSLLIWNNATPEGLPNDMTLHTATPVVKGVKHVITKWYRVRPWS